VCGRDVEGRPTQAIPSSERGGPIGGGRHLHYLGDDRERRIVSQAGVHQGRSLEPSVRLRGDGVAYHPEDAGFGEDDAIEGGPSSGANDFVEEGEMLGEALRGHSAAAATFGRDWPVGQGWLSG